MLLLRFKVHDLVEPSKCKAWMHLVLFHQPKSIPLNNRAFTRSDQYIPTACPLFLNLECDALCAPIFVPLFRLSENLPVNASETAHQRHRSCLWLQWAAHQSVNGRAWGTLSNHSVALVEIGGLRQERRMHWLHFVVGSPRKIKFANSKIKKQQEGIQFFDTFSAQSFGCPVKSIKISLSSWHFPEESLRLLVVFLFWLRAPGPPGVSGCKWVPAARAGTNPGLHSYQLS